MKFNSILVANRGEIASRIIKTSQKLGLKSIAVYVDADKDAPFVKQADEAIKISDGGYLDIDAIINAAKISKAEAIHPGYGFLSENALFAKRIQKEKLIWIGPSSEIISKMGDKLEAKELAIQSGIPTLPKTSDPKKINKIGFPLLIKAAAGGGGKGMRVVYSKTEFKDALAAAQREALSGFNDDRVFIEKYIEKSRHIEIQILGDSFGNIIHLGERECSIQRRYQKIIEETPSSRISVEVRKNMCDAAVNLAKNLQYTSAGTIEFLYDDKTDEFWFLEVNTRLQVEHPVTEMVTGIDLVAEQISIAQGNKISISQKDLVFKGHAIEARLYAEDPENNFLPDIGKMIAFEKHPNDDARWDNGIMSGSIIGTDFDPMLAKIISWKKTREQAALSLAKSLESAHIGGIRNNRDFLVSILRSEEFLDGDTTSDFLEVAGISRGKHLTDQELNEVLAIATVWIQKNNKKYVNVAKSIPANWTNGRLPKQKNTFIFKGDEISVLYKNISDNVIDVFDSVVEIIDVSSNVVEILFNSKRLSAKVTQDGELLLIHQSFGDILLSLKPRFMLPGKSTQTGGLTAPMPGKIIGINTKVGAKVKKGDTLLILEAMKMEHSIKATSDGLVKELFFKKNDQVENGATLLILEPKK